MVVSSSSALRSSLSSFLLPTKVMKLSLGNRITLLPLSNVAALSSQVTYPIKSEMSLCIGTHLIPHAFFISSHGGGAIAVADGVSGWAERDVDPALFSRELMAHASSMVDDTEVNYDPQVLLKKAHAATSSMGSATVIVAMMEGNGTLKIVDYVLFAKVSSVKLEEGDIVVMGSDGLFDNVYDRNCINCCKQQRRCRSRQGIS